LLSAKLTNDFERDFQMSSVFKLIIHAFCIFAILIVAAQTETKAQSAPVGTVGWTTVQFGDAPPYTGSSPIDACYHQFLS